MPVFGKIISNKRKMSAWEMVEKSPTEEMNKKIPTDERPMSLTFKSLITMGMLIIGSYGWLLNSLNSIKQDLNIIRTERSGDSKIQELQYQQLKNEVHEQGIRIKDIDAKYNILLDGKTTNNE